MFKYKTKLDFFVETSNIVNNKNTRIHIVNKKYTRIHLVLFSLWSHTEV